MENGLDFRIIQSLIEHKSNITTAIYTYITTKDFDFKKFLQIIWIFKKLLFIQHKIFLNNKKHINKERMCIKRSILEVKNLKNNIMNKNFKYFFNDIIILYKNKVLK